jgi:hypothetical protein
MLDKFSEYGHHAAQKAKDQGYDDTNQTIAGFLGGIMAELASCPKCDNLMAVNEDFTVGYCRRCDVWFYRKEQE